MLLCLGVGSVLMMPLAGVWLGYRQARAHRDAPAPSLRVVPDAESFRPPTSEVSLLGKLEYRSDSVTGAIAGATGPAGNSRLLPSALSAT